MRVRLGSGAGVLGLLRIGHGGRGVVRTGQFG